MLHYNANTDASMCKQPFTAVAGLGGSSFNYFIYNSVFSSVVPNRHHKSGGCEIINERKAEKKSPASSASQILISLLAISLIFA